VTEREREEKREEKRERKRETTDSSQMAIHCSSIIYTVLPYHTIPYAVLTNAPFLTLQCTILHNIPPLSIVLHCIAVLSNVLQSTIHSRTT
jgi:hypothetical protein